MKYLAISTLVVSSLSITPAFARYGTPPMGYFPPEPQNQVYFSGDIGYGALSTPNQNVVDPDGVFITAASNSNTSISGGGSIGFRHAISPLFAVGTEFGYDYDGRATYTEDYAGWSMDSTSYKVISQDLHVLATGTILFHNGFNIFAKGGAARVDQKLRITNQIPGYLPFFVAENNMVAFKPIAAAGIGYQYHVVGIYAQYSHIFGVNAVNFTDFVDPTTGNFTNIVSVDTFKVGMSVNLRV